MFKVSKHTLVVAAVIATAAAPSTASARFIAEDGSASAPAPSVSVKPTPYQQRQLAGYQQVAAKEFGNASVVPPGPVAQTRSGAGQSAANGFRWDDAGFGAAAMLGLLGAASATSVLARRRRAHHTPAI